MRWADTTGRYVRPLHGILAVFDGLPLSGEVDFGGDGGRIAFSNEARGHRFMAGAPFAVTSFADYRTGLNEAFVVLDAEERKAIIVSGLEKLAAAEGWVLRPDPGLADEVAGLVEWPVPLIGSIDPAFMEVPPEVLTTAMRTHQKYFSFSTTDGTLAPRFGVVANIAASDGGARILAGNERVLRARLSDAQFFWDQDRARTLEARLPELDRVVFHAKLGSVGDRSRRIEELATGLAGSIPDCSPNDAATAARFAKADLVSGMVGEFPELQGLMGRYYALHEGHSRGIADAIASQYSPAGPTDDCPAAPLSIAVALADKLDALAGFFAIGERPTGRGDPYALRRAALGVIRLVLESGIRLKLEDAIGQAWDGYANLPDDAVSREETVTGVLSFIADRLKVHLRGAGVGHDRIAAIFALGGEDDLVRLMARVSALEAFLEGEDGANLLIAYRRARNIVQIEEKKDGATYDSAVDPALFEQDEERSLDEALARAADAMDVALDREDYASAMAALAELRKPVDGFFDHVTVNVEEPTLRGNRLRLLSRIVGTMQRPAAFSELEGRS